MKWLEYLRRKTLARQTLDSGPAAVPPPATILDSYCRTAPCPENALNIFRDEWSSILPAPLAGMTSGRSALFADGRITWLLDEIGGVAGKRILELGPLEGGHTYMLEKAGAAEVLAIEANTRAFLKCLVVKELLQMPRAHFVCGDFLEYLRQPGPDFEICIASGVLYHMQDPVELLALLGRRCNGHLLLWTHCYDPAVILANPDLAVKFTGGESAETQGFRHTRYCQNYQAALAWNGFCGGNAPISHWLSRSDILAGLEHFGFEIKKIGFDDPKHPNGPAFAVIATKKEMDSCRGS
jgi:hypothetical protein